MSHKELELLVVELKNSPKVVTDVYERYVVYESYKRFLKNDEPLNLKWIQSTLKLSFPKVKKIIDDLIEKNYLIPMQSTKDKRVINLLPSDKLKKGIELFEMMKMNELFALGFQTNADNELPSLSELSHSSVDKIGKKFLNEFFD
tara:strand:+ start:700 stop:1134 length:435 start_codon:yes stop_codon:yes gene_type:complete